MEKANETLAKLELSPESIDQKVLDKATRLTEIVSTAMNLLSEAKEIAEELKRYSSCRNFRTNLMDLFEERERETGLRVRVLNCLHANDVFTLGELLCLSPDQVLKFRNCGRLAVLYMQREIKEKTGIIWE